MAEIKKFNQYLHTEYRDEKQMIAGKFYVRGQNLEFEKMFVKEIWEDKYYFRDGFGIEAGMRVLDIGGHIGIFSILADSLGGEVVAFEPVFENLQYFIRNMKENGNFTITPVFGAIGGQTQFDFVNIPDPAFETNTGKSYVGKGIEHYNQQKIAVYGINDVFSIFGKFDYIKLDCEGAEYDIIYSMTPEQLKSAKVYSMEFHGDVDKAKKLEEHFKANGFETRLDWAWGLQGSLKAKRI